MPFPFTDDVVQFIVLLTQHGTAEQVRAAISQNDAVMRFAAPPESPAGGSIDLASLQREPSAPPGDDADNESLAQSAFFAVRVPFVAICEVASDAGGSQIIATTDPAAFFRSVSMVEETALEDGGNLAASLRGVAAARRSPNGINGGGAGVNNNDPSTLNKNKALSCILLERRDTQPGEASAARMRGRAAATGARPLSVRDLFIQSMDLQNPLSALQSILQNIYDPMLRTHKTQSALRAQVQDLLTGIRSMHHVLPEIDITRYVHEDLLKLCDMNPQLDVPQLIDRLGEPAKDPSFIRRILQVRNKCNEALSMEPLLSGRVEEEELAKKRQNTNSKSYDASGAAAAVTAADATGHSVNFSINTAAAAEASGVAGASAAFLAGGYESEDDDSVWAVQERIVYWQCVLAWMEDVLKQLRGREWRLLHRLLAQRVETDYIAEYVGYMKLVQEYIAFLNTIPEKRLVNVREMKEFNTVADEILLAATRPTRFAPRLQLSLLTAVVSQIAWRWVSVMETQAVLVLDEDVNSSANGGESAGAATTTENSAASLTDGTSVVTNPAEVAVRKGETFDPIAALQTLRVAIHALRTLQARFIDHCADLRQQIRVVRNPRERVEHPRVEALLQRCIAVRDFLEGHLLLMRQLGVVFSTQVRLPFAVVKSTASALQPGEEYAVAMQDAYNECVAAVCGLRRGDGGSGSHPLSLLDHQARNNFLWRTSPSATHRFNGALYTYQQRRNQCDEQIALVVSQMLSNQQHTQDDDHTKAPTVTNFADSRGLRVFRTFKSFKMLPLERVQRVVHSYQDAMGEKLGAHVSAIQESYVNVQLTKQEVSYNVTRFNVSTLVAQIMWEQRLAEALTDAMVRFDYVSEHGWHQLLYLRNVEHYWRLNATLAEFIGVPLNLLACDELHLDSEVHGCAVALACLSLHYAEEANEWGQDEDLHVARELVETHDPGALAIARDRMLVGGAPRLYKTTARVRDIRSSRDIILQRISEHAASWYDEVDKLVSASPLDAQTMLLSGPVLWAVNCGPAGASYAASGGAIAGDLDVYGARVGVGGYNVNNNASVNGITNASLAGPGLLTAASSTNNINNNNNASGASANAGGSASRVASPSAVGLARSRARSISPSFYRGSFAATPGESPQACAATPAAAASMWMIEVAFPWCLPTAAEDLRYLEAAQLTSFVLANGGKGGAMAEMAFAGRVGASSGYLPSPRAGRSASASATSAPSPTAAGLAFLRDAIRGNELRSRLAHTLTELIHVYYATVDGEDAALVLLATDEYQEVNQMFQRGMQLRWNDEGLVAYVQQLADTMQTFATTVQQVRCKTESVYKKIKAFHVRAFHPETILQRVKALRRIVDALALRCVHAHLWTRQIQPLLEDALLTQMKYLMHSWTEDFLSMRGDVRFLEKGTETDVFRLTPLRIRMRVVYKEVRLESPCSAWRLHWISELNRFLSWVDVLPRLYKAEETQASGLALDTTSGSLPDLSMSNVNSASRRPSAVSATAHLTNSSTNLGGGVNSSNNTNNVAMSNALGNSLAPGGGSADGYQYLLMRLPASALAEPLHAIERCVQEAIDTEKEWRRGQQFLNMDVGLMQQRFGGDLRRWSHALGLMHTVTSRIMDYTQPNKLIGGIVILAQDAQLELGRKLDQVSQYAHAKFKDLLQGELEKSFQVITQERTKIDALDVISNVRDAAAFLSAAPGLKTMLQKMDSDITLMDEAETSLTKLGHIFPDHWMYAATVREEYTSLAELVERKLKAVQVRRPYLLEEARTTTAALETKIKALDTRFRNLDADTATKNAPVLAKQMVVEIHDEATGLEAETRRITAIQEALGEAPHVFTSLQQLLSDVSRVKDVWDHVASAYQELNELGAMPFFEMVPRRLHERLQAIEGESEHYPVAVQSYQLCRDLLSKLQKVLGYNRLMQDLRSDAMSPLERARRHWTALQQKLHTPWVLENIRVKDIWDSDPAANAGIYNEVIEMAQGERRIEVQLQNITNYWNVFEFSVIAYKKQVVLIRGWDEVLDRLTEDLSTFGGIRASPYFISPQLVAMTNEAEARLDRLRQVLETLLEVQKRWVYLDGIFAGNTEVRAQLPQDTVKFDRTSRELLHILPRPRSSGELPEVRAAFFLEDEKLQSTLERLLSQLTAVQRALSSYLDTQRGRFPRFFFVGDDDLLEIMGNSKNPLFLNKHLKKMFTALAALQLDGNVKDATTRLRGFASAEGEELSFQPGPVSFRQRPIHEWLGEAEQGMVFTLREATLKTYTELLSDRTHYAPLWSMEWIRRKPAQVVCLALQLMWTTQQEGLLTAPYDPSQNASAVVPSSSTTTTAAGTAPLSQTASSAVTKCMDELLVKLAGSVLDHGIEPSTRYRCEQLITIAVYQRDVSRFLAARKVTSSADFDWLRVLRLYVVPVNARRGSNNNNSSSKSLSASNGAAVASYGAYQSAETVECRMAEASVLHGFEYTGAYERLVQTPLTDKCYLTLMQALHTRLGGSPIGPAGTGKTETVKALGMQLGRHVLVFNCDDTFDYQAVSRIFLGLCQVGAWGCFDEFNRLEERILSALSLQIQVIQHSLRERRPQVQLNHRAVPLHPNVAIFITMNPGYAGRSKLPGNLKQLFRTVTMTIPDRETIAEVMLFAQGFTTAEALSQKVVPLFRLCEEQFTHQAHYDFGLRALKSVLVAAGDRKRQVAAAAAVVAPAGSSPESVQEAERTMLLESVIATIAPKLVTQDVALFYLLLHDFFPGRTLPTLPMAELRDAVAGVCAESGLSPAAGWVEKVLQLYHTKLTRHGVMIVGPSGTGKTTAWKVLMAAMVRIEKSLQMHAYVIAPKVLNKGELFGTLDVTTREWRDGVLTSILRRIIDAEEQQQIPDDMALAGNDEVGGGSVNKSLFTDNDSVADNKKVVAGDDHGGKSPFIVKTPANKKSYGNHKQTDVAEAVVAKEHWIIFDGDVDPEWVENLNSVLDDNRLLTLPNGERLPLPRSVRILFEVQDLRYATPATVSRCGMLWFSEGIVPLSGVLSHAYRKLQELPIVDARGRHLHWSAEEDMFGVAGPRRYGATDCVLTGGYGKNYHELIIANATQGGLEDSTGTPLPLRATMADDPLDSDAVTPLLGNAYGMRERSPRSGPEMNPESDLGSTLYGSTVYGGPSMYLTTSAGNNANRRSHPDAERIQEAMVGAWEGAFERGGAVARGLQLIEKAAFRDVCVMELDALEVVQSILAFLTNGVWRTFEAEQRNSEGAFSTATLEKIAAAVLSYAIFWGLSSSMNLANRAKLAKELELRPVVDGVAQSMVEVEVNYCTGEWLLVRNRVQETSILAEQVGANDTVIATVDTCRHEDVLSAWLGTGRSAILCGPPGSGKTMSITAVLNSLPEYEVVFLNFSSGTTVLTILKALEQYCTVHDTARGLVMMPSSGKQLLLFCDEINLPALDRYGTQVVVQFLRQLIERKGFFRARDNTWINVEDVQVVGACNPPTDPGRVPLSPRFLRWAPVLLVDFPSPESLLTIYTTYCRAILAWNERLCGQVATRLAQAMVQMYRSSQAKFTPIQQPHYLYSPRELSRWSRALYEGILTWDESTKRQLSVSQLVRLALHEGLRVFSDRLVSAEEREWTDAAIDESFRDNFDEVDPHTYDRPLLFSTLLSRSYTDSPREALRAYVQKRLASFNEEESLGDLVIYDSMIDHVVRIDRVLRQPLGHLLIAGSSGVGKTALTKLVAWMRGFTTFTLMVHRNYDLDDFENDLRAVLRRSGCKRERICFLFDESNILQPSFLEYMNALLASGEVPGLFDGEEWSKLMQEVRDAVLQSQSYYATSRNNRGGGNEDVLGGGGREGSSTPRRTTGRKTHDAAAAADVNDDEDDLLAATLAATTASVVVGVSKNASDDLVDVNSETELYHWFLTNVREYLHVVLTINPSSGEFTSRTVASPALVNRCTIDWFGDWDMTTLQQVSQARIRSLALLPVCHGVFATEQEAKEAVVDSLCMIHQATQSINNALRVRHANQGSFITPRHFTDCVSHFVAVFHEKQKVSSDALVHLRNGLTKLQQTSQEVSAQQATLRESEAQLEASSKRAQAMLERIVTETDTTKKEKAAAEALERQLQEEHNQISEDAKRMSVELAEAEPALKEADAALSTVKPEYLREIRAYTTPPPMVKRVLEAVCVLMGERNSVDWEGLKNQIRRDDFLVSVRNFRPDDITETARAQVRLMMKDSKFTTEAAYRASKAAGPLMQWVFFQVKYSAIYQRVAPMRTQIEALIKARDVKLKGLEKAQEEVRVKEVSLQQLMTEYQNATAQIGELKKRINTVSAKCNRAQTILRQLLDERDRWKTEVESSDLEARTTLGDCILSAVFLSYTGFYDEHTRERVLIPRWLKCLQSSAIPVREGLSVTEYLSPATQQLSWEEAGLPKDRLDIDNAAIMHRCQRYVLLIDPTGVAAQFVLRFYAEKKITKASFSRAGYAKQLEMAVRFGYPILMEDAEHLDPAVSPLLNGEVRCHGTRYITRIGPHEVDLAPSFRLFLHTRNPSFQPPPDLAGQVCIVNFTVTLSSLQSQCLHYMLLHERPDVDEKRSKLLKTQGEYQLRLRVLEENLLTRIAESEGSLLENDALIKSLEELKQEATRIARDIADSEDSLREIRVVEEQYRPIATAVAQAHFALQRFAELSPYYHYDVRFVLRVLDDALKMLAPPSSTATPAAESDRLHRLTYLLFLLLHRRVVRGMFNEDHLVWALRLAQLRSAMDASDTSKLAAAVNASVAAGINVPAAVGGGGGSPATDAVTPEEWEWILSCLRVTQTGNSGDGNNDPSSNSNNNNLHKDEFVVLPPVVRRACPTLGSQSRQALGFLLAKPAFKEIRLSFTTQSAAWESVLTSASPIAASEQLLTSDCFPRNVTRVRRLLLVTLVLLNTRRDAFSESARKLLSEYFSAKEMKASAGVLATRPTSSSSSSGAVGASALLQEDFFAPQTNDLAEDVMSELSEATPLLMVADTMFDPASRVEELARRTNATLYVVAMGSMESIESADAYVAETTKQGGWVLLKNVHLALGYMDKLEKQLHFQRSEQQLHKDFRLFLTAERDGSSARVVAAAATPSPTAAKVLPINLIESSVVVVYEAPPGMQSSLLQTYGEYPAAAEDEAADDKNTSRTGQADANAENVVNDVRNTPLQRLYLAAAWLHSVITERISYKPLGWCEAYEYTEVEYHRVVQAVQAWSTSTSGTLTVSWDALRAIVATTVYGGKVSNAFDQHVLDTFCRKLLSTDTLRDGAELVPKTVTDAASSPPLPPIVGRTRHELLQWVRGLAGGSSDPAWLALPVGADRMTRARSAIAAVERLSLVQTTLDDELTFVDVDDMANGIGGVAAGGGSLLVGDESEISGTPLSLQKASSSANAGAAARTLHATRWAAKVQSYCVAWYPPLADLFEKLQRHAFVTQAMLLHEQESKENADGDVYGASGGGHDAAHGGVAPPLVLAVQREVVAAMAMMRHLVTDLRELREVVMEERTPSSVHRGLVEELMKDHVPVAWAAHLLGVHGTVSRSLFVGIWIADVQQRVEHLLELATAADAGDLSKKPVCLGLLFSPGAFLTAFKQQCARTDRVPLERLVPQIEVVAAAAGTRTSSSSSAGLVPRSADEMVFLGLTLYSAQVDAAGKCALTSVAKTDGAAGVSALSSAVALRWKWVSSSTTSVTSTSLSTRLSQQCSHQQSILLPFYTTENRESLLEVLDVAIAVDRTSAEMGINVWYERGACIAAWTASD